MPVTSLLLDKASESWLLLTKDMFNWFLLTTDSCRKLGVTKVLD